MSTPSPFKWRHFESEIIVLCALVPALFAQLSRSGGDDGRARTLCRSYHHLPLSSSAIPPSSTNDADHTSKPPLTRGPRG